jgi:hypothetical protein
VRRNSHLSRRSLEPLGEARGPAQVARSGRSEFEDRAAWSPCDGAARGEPRVWPLRTDASRRRVPTALIPRRGRSGRPRTTEAHLGILTGPPHPPRNLVRARALARIRGREQATRTGTGDLEVSPHAAALPIRTSHSRLPEQRRFGKSTSPTAVTACQVRQDPIPLPFAPPLHPIAARRRDAGRGHRQLRLVTASVSSEGIISRRPELHGGRELFVRPSGSRRELRRGPRQERRDRGQDWRARRRGSARAFMTPQQRVVNAARASYVYVSGSSAGNPGGPERGESAQ